jgi:four helix bundle protein
MALAAEDLAVLRTAESIADSAWKLVVPWEEFARDVVGRQLVSAADGIGAHIAEAFGRERPEEKLQFLYIARGSLFEAKYWLNRAQARGLLQPAHVESYLFALTQLARQLNGLAAATRGQRPTTNTLRERAADYEIDMGAAELFTESDLDYFQTAFNPDMP